MIYRGPEPCEQRPRARATATGRAPQTLLERQISDASPANVNRVIKKTIPKPPVAIQGPLVFYSALRNSLNSLIFLLRRGVRDGVLNSSVQ
jgi:hypothetical protein